MGGWLEQMVRPRVDTTRWQRRNLALPPLTPEWVKTVHGQTACAPIFALEPPKWLK